MRGLLVSGACGRMGKLVAGEAPRHGFTVLAGVDPLPGNCGGFPVYPSFPHCAFRPDIILDFSTPASLPGLLSFAVEKTVPAVLGTTGYSSGDLDAIREASRFIPLFQSPNMSVGVFVLRKLAALAAQMLPGFDVEIVEKHHRQKADAPSGTAIELFRSLAGDGSRSVCGRQGADAARGAQEIGIHSVRGGTLAGEHEVGFYGAGETLLIGHRAQSREIFAAGALKAAVFLLGQSPGLYGMEDLLRLSAPARQPD